MSKKELNVEENEVVESEEITEETKKPGIISRIKTFGKKHGKKLAIGTGTFALGLIGGIAIGKNQAYSESYEDYEIEDLEIDEDSVASDDVTE